MSVHIHILEGEKYFSGNMLWIQILYCTKVYI